MRNLMVSRLALLVIFASALGPLARSAEASGYMLPWATCTWRKVIQGWNNPYSHTGTQHYAYDFNHWEGQGVYAARHGTVRWIRDDIPADSCCSSGSCANNANRVVINHSDGKATLYLHLKDVSVSPNQTVQRGQRIGTAGKTGYTSCNPHLHYQRQNQGIWFTQSVSGYFAEYAGVQLQEGWWYLSMNTADGDTDCYPWARPHAEPDQEVVSPHRSIALDGELIALLAASPLTTFRRGEEIGLSFASPANVEPRLHRVEPAADWPEYLPTWNLHFQVAVSPQERLPLDAQLEGYPAQDDLRSLLRLQEQAGSMERVELLEERRVAGSEVTIWRWENVAGSFLSAARVDPAGIVMIHASTEALPDGARGAAAWELVDDFLLPQIVRLTWSRVSSPAESSVICR